jgi:hypothetical protein
MRNIVMDNRLKYFGKAVGKRTSSATAHFENRDKSSLIPKCRKIWLR